MKQIIYDRELSRLTSPKTLVCLQIFNHSINYGYKEDQQIILTITTKKEAIAPRTIVLNSNLFDQLLDYNILLDQEGILLDDQHKYLFHFNDGEAWDCLPLKTVTEPAKIYHFLGWLEKERVLIGDDLFLLSHRKQTLFEEHSRRMIIDILADVKLSWELQNWHEVTYYLSRLLGLGVGLTPTGDDVLTGILASLSASGHLVPNILELKKIAIKRTNMVSYAEIEEALAERFALSIQMIFSAISLQDDDAIKESVEQLRKVGSTSGDDLLAGIIFGLKLLI